MTVLCVDDERLLLDTLVWAVDSSPDVEQAVGFDDEYDALEWIKENRCDAAFLDIRMHDMGGLELAEKLRAVQPELPVVFCTGYREYAVDAFTIHADGYLLKPVTPEAVQRELDHLRGTVKESKLIRVRCFGSFEIYAAGAPLRFQRSKTKELFAYLIDRRGAGIRSKELCALLWGGSMDETKSMNYLHHLFGDLRRRLASVGADSVLVAEAQEYAVDTALIDCDYYRYLDGDEAALRSFTGEYMSGYDWARATAENISRR